MAQNRTVRCPVAATLDIVGDRWTLLVVRDLLRGRRRYSEIAETVEGIPSSVLSDRLKLLEREWNEPAKRHALWCHHDHPINFNLGRLMGGEWHSSVATTARADIRLSFYPGMSREQVLATMGNPFRREVDENTEFLIYDTDNWAGSEAGRFTPICIKEGKVTGWGRSYYDNSLKIKSEITVK